MADDQGKAAATDGGGTVADRILRFRRDAGLTQQALAAFLGVSQRTVSRWERGVDRPSASVLDRMSTLFGEAGQLPSVYEAVRNAAVPLALIDDRGRVLVASRPYQAARGEEASSSSTGLPLALVIEDDEAVLKATRAVLKRWQFLSVGVTDGRSAIDLVAAREVVPDAAIIDFLLPGDMDGVETAKALRRILPTLPVIIVTGEGNSHSLRKIADAGLAVVAKPVDPQHVHVALMALLQQPGPGEEEGGR
ncbi:response regulator [Novispirillum sp. DQ9]|uniref:response regulator n=1 Tax=Novispirillum sp. DQ9 TaxID=3398612 RepID=UPI003C7EC729